jgi:1-phosphatidylinositol phosphodiesterase
MMDALGLTRNFNRLFGNWRTEDTPSIISYKDTLYMCVSDTDGRIYVVTYDKNTGLWNQPEYQKSCLFKGWQTFKNRTPNFMLQGSQLSMVLLDTNGVIHTTQFDTQRNSWSEPSKPFGGWKALFTPTTTLHNGTLYMCLSSENGSIYTTPYNEWTQCWNQPGNKLFNGWETFYNRTPSIISYQDTMMMALMDTNGGVFTSKWSSGSWTHPEKIFGGWKNDYCPKLSIFKEILYMCICDTNGCTYMTSYNNRNSAWNSPIYKQTQLFGSGETYCNITPKICSTSLLGNIVGLNRWMKAIPDTKSISQISMSGTHDSCSYQGSGATWKFGQAWAQCQETNIHDQLSNGIRYFDIRCKVSGNNLDLHHGEAYLNETFDGFLKVCYDFLNKNPSEFLIVAIGQTGGDTIYPLCSQLIRRNPSQWYLENKIPTIGSVRGKIILLRRFTTTDSFGMDANSGWNSDINTCTVYLDSSQTEQISIQDRNEMSGGFSKVTIIKTQLTNAAAQTEKNPTLYLNFSSATTPGNIPKPIFLIAKGNPILINEEGINNILCEYVVKLPKGRYGVVNMDFVDYPNNQLSPLIITKNQEIFAATR